MTFVKSKHAWFALLLSVLVASVALAATKTFDGTVDVTLESYDSLFEGQSTGIELNGSGAIRVVTEGAAQKVRYENAQGDTHYSQITFSFDSSGGYVWVIAQHSGSQQGYEARLSGTNAIELRENSDFADSTTFGGADWSAGATYTCGIDYVHTTGVVRVFCASGAVADARTSGTLLITYNDGSPLTGGYPAFEMRSLFDQNNTTILGWTDGISSGTSALPKIMQQMH